MQAVATPSTHSSKTAINTGLKGLVLVLTLAFLGVIGWNLRDTTVHEGDRAPNFAVRTDEGQEITPVNFGGKILVLNFWASWCRTMCNGNTFPQRIPTKVPRQGSCGSGCEHR